MLSTCLTRRQEAQERNPDLKGYQWPASALTVNEMAILSEWKERTGTPITQLIKQAIVEMDKIIRRQQP